MKRYEIIIADVVKGFAMPVRLSINGKELKLTPTEATQTYEFSEEIKTFEVNRNFYSDTAKSSF